MVRDVCVCIKRTQKCRVKGIAIQRMSVHRTFRLNIVHTRTQTRKMGLFSCFERTLQTDAKSKILSGRGEWIQ